MFTQADPTETKAEPDWSTPQAAAPLHGATRRARSPRRWLIRLAKLAAALGVLGVGLGAVLSEQGVVASGNAVVSAYVIALRTPIEGVVSGMTAAVGAVLPAGTAIGRVVNPLADDTVVSGLRERLSRQRAELAAAATQREALSTLRLTLLQRAAAFQQALGARLAAEQSRAEHLLAAHEAERERDRRERDRKRTLNGSGAVASAELDRAEAALSMQEQETAALAAAVAAKRTEVAALAAGVISDNGGGDVAYSVQRADELAIRLAELDRSIAALAAEAAATATRLDREAARIARLTTAEIRAPRQAMVWKLGVTNGEHLAAGETVAELVDCDAAFLVVAVPQTRLPEIAAGGVARFRLSGEQTERTGIVQVLTGQEPSGADRHLAASPAAVTEATAAVLVALPPGIAGACLVGRTARVVLPAAGGGALRRLLQRLV